MDSFRTSFPPPEFPFRIDHHSPILSMGSCFAEEMGMRLARLKFPHLLNPFGIVYHPLVLAKLLDELSGRQQSLNLADSFEAQGLWRHYAFHSRFARPIRTELEKLLHQRVDEGRQFIQGARVLLLTLGTAYGYRLRSNGTWVNNCHKQAATTFVRERASVDDIVTALGHSLAYLQQVNPDLQVLLTVSPVRHAKDGLLANQRSKAILLLATEALTERFANVHYFPAYEYLLDDLRDYRFYGPDMLHPNTTATEYIWQQFTAACWGQDTRILAERIEKLVRAAEHRPLHPDSPAYEAFRQAQQTAIQQLLAQQPELDFSRELDLLKKRD